VAFAGRLSAPTKEVLEVSSLFAKAVSRRSAAFAGVRHAYPAMIALFVLACVLLPRVVQDPQYHGFADQRAWLGVPHAADVLSNLAFALVGLIAIARLVFSRRPRFEPATESGLWCVAIGLIGTAAGSAWYHLEPSNASLFWDRLPMTLALAGVLGTALAQRVPGSAGRSGLPLLVALGAGTVVYWRMAGDLAPYVTLQLGGILMLLALLVLTSKGSDPFPWAWVIVWYALAKILESFDRQIWDATGGLVAGHALKHLAAASASAAALWPLLRPHRRRIEAGTGRTVDLER
jgi:hypothetical protein